MNEQMDAIVAMIEQKGGKATWEDVVGAVSPRFHQRLFSMFTILEASGRARRVNRRNPVSGAVEFYVTTSPKPADGIEVD